ncbi:helical backbone metal receptor [Methanocalculus sp.]|uniref:helical backbone metal receptor n=1 Tax=Methanocalculus sp. TaxID=2004547 RepID=UPI0027210F0E|nr:helical backbone metal receptor [Methanocalculus sp.]MDO8842312.1 helical backbone metal receptor [Methanocalculus sp.]
MKKMSILLLLVILLSTSSTAAYPISTGDQVVTTALEYLRSSQKDDGGFGEVGRESSPGTTSWAILTIYAAGEDPRDWVKNGNNTVDYLRMMNKEMIEKGGTTDSARTILTLHAVSIDPGNFDGIDYVGDLKNRVKPNGQAGDHVYTTIWTIIALASVGEDTSASVRWLSKQQNEDGGFPWTIGAESDPDDTGAALQALIAAGVPKTDATITKAVAYLRSMQQDDGGFHYGGTSATNSASDAWVIQGLVAAGVDPSTLIKKQGSVIDHLIGLQNIDGSFRHTAHVTDNPCRMTASAVPALIGAPYPIMAPVISSSSSQRSTIRPEQTLPTFSYTALEGDRVVTVRDDFGTEVTINGYPERVVSLAPSNTEILFALGLSDRVIGVTDYCDYPSEALTKPRVGGYSTINLEKVVAAQPDLVLAAYGNTGDMINRMRSLGLVVVALNPTTLDGVLENIALIGEITGTEEAAAVMNADLRKRIAAVTEKTDTLTDRPSAAHLVWYDPLWISGGGTFQSEVIRMAGGTNSFEYKEEWGVVGFEDFITADPDYIFVSSGTGMGSTGYDIIYEYVLTEPRLRNLKAVLNDHVILVDADIISRASPRIVDALEEVAEAMHPELFPTSGQETGHIARSPGAISIPVVALLIFALIVWRRRV